LTKDSLLQICYIILQKSTKVQKNIIIQNIIQQDHLNK